MANKNFKAGLYHSAAAGVLSLACIYGSATGVGKIYNNASDSQDRIVQKIKDKKDEMIPIDYSTEKSREAASKAELSQSMQNWGHLGGTLASGLLAFGFGRKASNRFDAASIDKYNEDNDRPVTRLSQAELNESHANYAKGGNLEALYASHDTSKQEPS